MSGHAEQSLLLAQERLFDQSDAYRVHVCESCGLFAVANLKKNQFHCPSCKNTTGIVQVWELLSLETMPLLALFVTGELSCRQTCAADCKAVL